MYTISFEIAALILSLFALLYSLTVRRRQYLLPKGFMAKLQSQHSVFILVLLSNLLASLSSVGGVYLQGMATEQTAYYMYLLHALYFFFHSMLAMGFALYIMNVTGAGTDRSKVFWILFFLPFLISELPPHRPGLLPGREHCLSPRSADPAALRLRGAVRHAGLHLLFQV